MVNEQYKDIYRKPTDEEIREFIEYHEENGLVIPDPVMYPKSFLHQFRRHRLVDVYKSQPPIVLNEGERL